MERKKQIQTELLKTLLDQFVKRFESQIKPDDFNTIFKDLLNSYFKILETPFWLKEKEFKKICSDIFRGILIHSEDFHAFLVDKDIINTLTQLKKFK